MDERNRRWLLAAAATTIAVVVIVLVVILEPGPAAPATANATPTSVVRSTAFVPTPTPGVARTAAPATARPSVDISTHGPRQSIAESPFRSGEAAVTLGDKGTGEASLQLVATQSASVSDDGVVYPNIAFSDAAGANSLTIVVRDPSATGVFDTSDGNVGVGFRIGQANLGGFQSGSFAGQVGAPDPVGLDPGACIVTINPGSDGAIQGTVQCQDLNDPTLPVSLDATFAARP